MIRLITTTIFAAGLLLAQGPGGRGMHRGPGGMHGGPEGRDLMGMKSYLQLSDAQVAQMKAAGEAAREAQKANFTAMREKTKALRAAQEAANPDPAAIGRQVLELQAMRKQMQEARAKTREQMQSFLTAEQKAKLAELEKARQTLREARPGRRGPGREGRGPGAERNFRRL
jgi:Spy/CpxP family protein refolding chaperone